LLFRMFLDLLKCALLHGIYTAVQLVKENFANVCLFLLPTSLMVRAQYE